MATGACYTWLVSNSTWVNQHGTANAFWGITRANQYINGYLTQNTINELVEQGELLTGLQGLTWLVRGGEVYIDESIQREKPSKAFVKLIAPRLAVGHDKLGRFIAIQVDGFEPAKYGVDLYDFAHLCKQQGMISAINLDGGGSVTVLYNNQIKNSCSDACRGDISEKRCPVPYGGSKCLRKVSSFVCLK
ncbi:hypothetical protein P9112_009108 [Eukaryota sp. TZLM1-RC]